MPLQLKRILATGVAAALAVGALVMAAPPAAASVSEKNTKFCTVLTAQGQPDIQGLNPDSAAFASKQISKLLKTNPPSGIKKALSAIRKYYKGIANGGSTGPPSSAGIQAFTTLSRYIAANCRAGTPST